MPSPILSVAEMREWEQATWASGQSEDAVIRRAGGAIASVAHALTREGEAVVILAGKGHNGDDARQAARQLTQRETRLLNVDNPASALGALEEHLSPPPALVIDGLFGIGLNRALSKEWVAFIRRLNECGLPVLAVDTPSGLHADEGTPQPEAVTATWTVTLGAVKQGLLEPAAWPHVGRLLVAPEIGLAAFPMDTECHLTQASDFSDFPPRRAVEAHKGSFGHVLIIAGSMGYHGAAVLSARGAQRAQPGLITLYTQESVYGPVAAQLQSVMVRPCPENMTLPPRCSAILMGPGLADPGLSDSFRESMKQLWRSSKLPVIADASALDWLPKGAVCEGALRVMTPHAGEAARLLGAEAKGVTADRLRSVRRLSETWGGAQVVLKGHHTLSGGRAGRVGVNSTGNPKLAQGGSGDVLAGYLAGLLAQPGCQERFDQTIAFAVWQHGASADWLEATQSNWTVEDLAEALGEAPRVDLIV